MFSILYNFPQFQPCITGLEVSRKSQDIKTFKKNMQSSMVKSLIRHQSSLFSKSLFPSLPCFQSYHNCDRHRPFVCHHLHLKIFQTNPQNSSITQTNFQFSPIRLPINSSILKSSALQLTVISSEKLKIMLATLVQPQPALRTFVFEREETQQSIIIQHQIDLRLNFIDLNRLLGEYCPPMQHRIAIYDPNLNHFVRFDNIGAQNGYLHRDYLEPKIVMIRYSKRYDLPSDSDSVDSSMEPDSHVEKKEGRSKERTIAEVIEMVKKWRNLHLHGHKSMRRRLNLQDAAKLIGISKKSLDDYYCQLRLGEFYEFDFASNLHEKIGVLRTFVKQHKDKNPALEQKRKQNQKHPKNLKVIDHFQLSTKTLSIPQEEKMVQQESSPLVMQQNQQQPYQQNYLLDPLDELQQNSNHVYEQLFNLQHDFFKGFELALDDLHDPYNSIQHDFRKKQYEDDSNSFLYF